MDEKFEMSVLFLFAGGGGGEAQRLTKSQVIV